MLIFPSIGTTKPNIPFLSNSPITYFNPRFNILITLPSGNSFHVPIISTATSSLCKLIPEFSTFTAIFLPSSHSTNAILPLFVKLIIPIARFSSTLQYLLRESLYILPSS